MYTPTWDTDKNQSVIGKLFITDLYSKIVLVITEIILKVNNSQNQNFQKYFVI